MSPRKAPGGYGEKPALRAVSVLLFQRPGSLVTWSSCRQPVIDRLNVEIAEPKWSFLKIIGDVDLSIPVFFFYFPLIKSQELGLKLLHGDGHPWI